MGKKLEYRFEFEASYGTACEQRVKKLRYRETLLSNQPVDFFHLASRLVAFCSLLCITKGEIDAFVADFDYISPVDRYELEREVFNQSNDDWYREFDSFDTWMDKQNRSLVVPWSDIGRSFIDMGGTGIVGSIIQETYQNTREGHAAQAPENFATGEP